MLKRSMDLVISAIALAATLPILCCAALAIRLSSRGPILFRQVRVGRNGVPFEILKLRSMRFGNGSNKEITVGRDPRITMVGNFLRQTKFDELPQFINILRGDMSLVGPRPEVPQFVALYPPELRDKVLSVRPGITDRSSIRFRNEAELLAMQPDPELYYRTVLLPEKLEIAAQYAERHSMAEDLRIILGTISAVVWPRSGGQDR